MAFISLMLLTNHELILEMFRPLVCFRGIIRTECEGFLELWLAKLDLQMKAFMQLVNTGCFEKGFEILQDMFVFRIVRCRLIKLADFISVPRLWEFEQLRNFVVCDLVHM